MQREAIVMLGLLGLSAPVLAAGTPEQKCQAGKNETAAKYSLCRAKAEKKLVLGSSAGDYAAALASCEAKFSRKWQGLEQKAVDASTTCPSTADEAKIEGLAAVHGDRVAWEVSGTGRYSDNADGTITDKQTGLQWEKKVKLGGGPDFANLQDADNNYLWSGFCSISGDYCQPDTASATACAAGVEGDAHGCSECGMGDGTCDTGGLATVWQWLGDLNTASFGGHNDWRLPVREELQGLADLTDGTPPTINVAFQGASCGEGCTDVTSAACACTKSSSHWSASTYASFSYYAWFVYFHNGDVEAGPKGVPHYVRAVRGGS